MGNCCGLRRSRQDSSVPKGYGTNKKVLQQQYATWQATGVVSLRSCGLKVVPRSVAELAAIVRVVDVSENKLDEISETIRSLLRLERLSMADNLIVSMRLPSEGFPKLKFLDLTGNVISEVPEALGLCTALETLKLGKNKLLTLPACIGRCTNLKQLFLAGNAIARLPDELGSLSRLESLDASQNQLEELPEALGALSALRVLQLNCNRRLHTVPGAVLTGCQLLHTLDVHETSVTRERLEAVEGYAAFEERRRAKFSKNMASGAMLPEGGFDEGVDVQLKGS